jgi:hypothetical protein
MNECEICDKVTGIFYLKKFHLIRETLLSKKGYRFVCIDCLNEVYCGYREC